MVRKIIQSNKLEDVLDNIENFHDEYKVIMKKIHPDICNDPDAAKASAKLNLWIDELTHGKHCYDDGGGYTTNKYWIKFVENDLTKLSLHNYKTLMNIKGKSAEHFQKYLPELIEHKNGTITYKFFKRSIPLADLVLPQEHVNWILNRILEYSAYLSEIGFVHAGFNPNSIFIIPENHQIQISSFYHMTKIDSKIKTISGKYKNWYPVKMFADKIAKPVIDTDLAKRISLYLLGDKSGVGTKLRKTINQDFLNFTLRQHDNSYRCMDEYKKMLKQNFESKFHILDI